MATTDPSCLDFTRWISPEIAAASLGWHLESVRRACREGRLPAIKTGRTWRINIADLPAPANALLPDTVALLKKADTTIRLSKIALLREKARLTPDVEHLLEEIADKRFEETAADGGTGQPGSSRTRKARPPLTPSGPRERA